MTNKLFDVIGPACLPDSIFLWKWIKMCWIELKLIKILQQSTEYVLKFRFKCHHISWNYAIYLPIRFLFTFKINIRFYYKMTRTINNGTGAEPIITFMNIIFLSVQIVIWFRFIVQWKQCMPTKPCELNSLSSELQVLKYSKTFDDFPKLMWDN